MIDLEIIYDRRNSELKLNPSSKFETSSFQPWEFFSLRPYHLMSACVWSLGALLYDMITNENFHDENLISWNKKIKKLRVQGEHLKKRVQERLHGETSKIELKKKILLIRPEIIKFEEMILIKDQIIEYIQSCMQFKPKDRISIHELYQKTRNFNF